MWIEESEQTGGNYDATYRADCNLHTDPVIVTGSDIHQTRRSENVSLPGSPARQKSSPLLMLRSGSPAFSDSAYGGSPPPVDQGLRVQLLWCTLLASYVLAPQVGHRWWRFFSCLMKVVTT